MNSCKATSGRAAQEMNRRRSSRGGGAAHDVEPERCRLAGTGLPGSHSSPNRLEIYKKKKHTRQEQETKRLKKIEWREKMDS